MFHKFEFIWACINDLLIITKRYCSNHLDKLELMQQKIKHNETNSNTEKAFFGQTQM